MLRNMDESPPRQQDEDLNRSGPGDEAGDSVSGSGQTARNQDAPGHDDPLLPNDADINTHGSER
jgi:hypothetical protein